MSRGNRYGRGRQQQQQQQQQPLATTTTRRSERLRSDDGRLGRLSPDIAQQLEDMSIRPPPMSQAEAERWRRRALRAEQHVLRLQANEPEMQASVRVQAVADADAMQMQLIRGRHVQFIRQHFRPIAVATSAADESEISARKTLSVFGLIYLDRLEDILAEQQNIRCPHVSLRESKSTGVPKKLEFPNLQLAPDSRLKATIMAWITEHGLDLADTDDEEGRILVAAWRDALETLLHFVSSQLLLPEEQYRSKLWAPLLDALLFKRIDSEIRYGPEFKMRTVPAYLGVDARTDYGCWFEAGNFRVTTVVLEAAPNRSDGTDPVHKDLMKIAVEMEACLMSDVSILKEPWKKPRMVFGFLTSAAQIRLCVLTGFPVRLENGSWDWTFVFQAPDAWFVDLAPESPDSALPQLESIDGNSRFVIHDLRDLPPPPSSDNTETEPDIDVQIEISTSHEDWPRDNMDTKKLQPSLHGAEVIMPRLQRLKNICDAIIGEIRGIMADYRQPGNLKEPDPVFRLPKRFEHHLPKLTTSSKGKDGRSGSQLMQTPSKTGAVGRTTRSSSTNVEQALAYGVAEHLCPQEPVYVKKNVAVVPCHTVVNCPIRALIVKPYVAAELQSLKRLRNKDNIVQLFHSRMLQYPMIMYHMEYLEVATDWLDFGDFYSAMWYGIRMVEDGLSALCALRDAWILHRDISTSNFLYSRLEGKWKLTDFDLAVCLYSSDDDTIIADQVVGTKEYIAPESTQLRQYSYASDVFGMGATLEELLMPAQFTAATGSRHAMHALFGRAVAFSDCMMHPKPECRLVPKKVMSEIRRLVAEARELREAAERGDGADVSDNDW